MATYTYDDLRVTLTARTDGTYDQRALLPDGRHLDSVFTVPLSDVELEEAVLHVARGNSRKASADPNPSPPPTVPTDVSTEVDVEQLGAALAGALFGADLGREYDSLRQSCEREQRGLRLTLSLAGAPALLSLPWEFLYRRPRFLASQRHTPLVRHLETGTMTSPPTIESTVRILGVISSPRDIAPLDVDAEKARVEKALEKTIQLGRVELDWLDPATPRGLREALRDGTYHILHYVGHSSFTDANEGVIYLEDADGRAREVDGTALATLLSDQNRLRLVVLNSCQGARTTINDPYAGVATTLIQLGVPAVVAMQFEISDDAAILFAEELYTNLIGRQDPIDASVAEARKAIYIELDKVEWATPVLFLRDPDVQLFNFRMPVAPLPPPPPPDRPERIDVADEPDPQPQPDVHQPPETLPPETLPPDAQPPEHQPPSTTKTAKSTRGEKPPMSTARKVALIGGGAVLVVGAVIGIRQLIDDNNDEGAITTTVVATNATPETNGGEATVVTNGGTGAPSPRPRTGFLAVQIDEGDGETHLYPVRLDDGQVGIITNKQGAVDTQPVWDWATNRVAFTRERDDDGPGLGIFYVVPGNFAGDDGKQVAPLVPWNPGEFEHFPAWSADGALFYAQTNGCAPSPDCGEDLRRARFDTSVDDAGFLDVLTPESDDLLVPSFTEITAIAADHRDPNRLVLADRQGLWLIDTTSNAQLIEPGRAFASLTYTADGQFIVGLSGTGTDQTFHVFDRNGSAINEGRIIGSQPELAFSSITAEDSGRTMLALTASTQDPRAAVVSRLQVLDDGRVGVIDVVPVLNLGDIGTPQAIAI